MTASPDSLQQRYEAIERVYSERRWDEVASLSESLLLELPDDPGDPLRQRLQLLLGHTYLYGYKDTATASGFYSRVQAVTSEAVLRDIADQGLQQCASQDAARAAAAAAAMAAEAEAPAHANATATVTATADVAAAEVTGAAALTEPIEPAPATTSAGQAFPFSATPVPNPSPQAGGLAAMPWMEQLSGVDPAAMAPRQAPATAEPPPAAPAAAGSASAAAAATFPDVLAVEVVEEPEQIEVAQADPARAEELELTLSQPESNATDAAQPTLNPQFSPEELAELSRGLLRVVIR